MDVTEALRQTKVWGELKRKVVGLTVAKALAEEVDRLRTLCELGIGREQLALSQEIVRLRKPDYYWDDRNLDAAIAPSDVCAYDAVGDVVPLRPIHELPTVWALVTDDGVQFFNTEKAAKAALEGK